MPARFHLEHLFPSPLFYPPIIAALVILTALYTARRISNSIIPLYVSENAAAGNEKQRWMYDSVNLLQEAYKKVRAY